MAEFENESVTGSASAGKQPSIGEKGGHGASSKSKSADAKGYAKKKKDALEGKERENARGNLDSEQERRNSGEKTKGEGGGAKSSQSLQSGQTTVQFSSGGGAGNASAALNSLLGLFASSANLAHAEARNLLSLSNQTINFLPKGALQISSVQISAAFERGALKEAVAGSSEKLVESVNGKFNQDTGATSVAHGSSSGSQDTFSQLLNSISAQASESQSEQGTSNFVTLNYTQGGGYYTPAFNVSNFFFSSQVPFTFGNSSSPYLGVITNYLQNVGISSTGPYSYQLAGVLPSSGLLSQTFPSGVTFTPGASALFFDTTVAPAILSPVPTGITLTSTGDLYVNASQPMSVSFTIDSPGNPSLTVRIDAGPGPVITSPNNSFNGSPVLEGTTSSGQYQSVVLSDSVGYALIGTGANLNINSGGSNAITTNNASVGLPSTGTYAFPSNTLYQHIGTDLQTVPSTAAYGNFDNASGYGNIYLPNAPAFDTLTMGGNVLDVYGTKYGVANTLNVVLPGSPAPAAINTLTLGGNTLAGFGTSYGDLQTLTVTAQPGNSPATLGPTDFIFRGNVLAVDKNIGSILYPHLETLDMQKASGSTPANVSITFQDSLIQGNTGSDTFYGDIQNLTNLSGTTGSMTTSISTTGGGGLFLGGTTSGSTTSGGLTTGYSGFDSGVTVTNVGGQVTTTTSDGNNNSITWGNDIYVGGGQDATGGTVARDTYNFTLLEDTATQKAVMQGNALLTSFDLSNDTLNFQISPTLFRALDGADGQGHNKQINVGDLNASVTFGGLTAASLDATQNQYLTQNGISLTASSSGSGDGSGSGTGATTYTSTAISFDGGLGGSLNLVGDAGLISFAGIPNLTTTLVLAYVPVAALPEGSIVVPTPRTAQPFLYNDTAGTTASGSAGGGFYFNDLDNFFANSLLATYAITGSGVTISPTALTSAPAGAVAIDKYGTIAVGSSLTTPILTSLAITATDQQGATASTTQFFGFLNAPVTTASNSSTTPTEAYGTGTTNIISGDGNLTIYGEPTSTFTLGNSGAMVGSNLIVDTTGASASTTAYGDYKTMDLTVQGGGGNSPLPASVDNKAYTFGTNAFYVSGSVYGIAQAFDILAQGGLNDAVKSGDNANASAHLTNTAFNFGTQGAQQTIYGNTTIYGELQSLSISDIAGSGAKFQGNGNNENSSPATLNISSEIKDNTFNFAPVTITVYGDASAQTTNIYPNLGQLFIGVEPTSNVSSSSSLTLTTTATFQGNTFAFGNDTATGGLGYTNFYGTPDLNFIDASSGAATYAYQGFLNGVTTSLAQNGQLVVTTSDGYNNKIIWGNDTFTGGTGANTYNFTLLYNTAGTNTSDAVFSGNDVITFRNGTDKLALNLAPNLYNAIPRNSSGGLNLDAVATFSNSNGNTLITFNAPGGTSNGSLTLEGVAVSSFTSLSNLTVHEALVTPTLNPAPAFDPVFAAGSNQPVLSAFVNNAASSTTYATTMTNATGGAVSGVSLNTSGSNAGTLNISASAPESLDLTGSGAMTGSSVLPLPDAHIFVSDAPFVTHDATSSVISGATAAAAYEVTAGTVYGGGADIALPNASLTYNSKLIFDASTVTHTIYGDVQNITYDGSIPISNRNFTFKSTLINANIGSGDQIFGDAQNINLSLPSASASTFTGNTFTFNANTLYGSGSLYGDVQTITLDDGFTSAMYSNNFKFGANTLTSGAYVYSSSAFDSLVGSASPTSLYAGVDKLVFAGTPQGNIFSFQDSALVGVGSGGTQFYGDINNLSATDFDTSPVTASSFLSSFSSNGQVQIVDASSNKIIFGNDTMTGSEGRDTFNINLFATATGDVVAAGKTTIANFDASTDILNLHLSQTLYDDITGGAGGPITSPMFDSYMTSHNVSFGGGGQFSFSGDAFGSIALSGASVSSFSDLGPNLYITAGNQTWIDPPPDPATVYNVAMSGDTVSSFTQDMHIIDVSSLGHIVDFAGTVDLSMSNALFKSLGLSDSNTAAQNLQILENDAHAATGGIVVTETTTGSGEDAVTNTVLTFESTTSGVVNTYGSITLHDTHFNPLDPLSAHLQVIHH